MGCAVVPRGRAVVMATHRVMRRRAGRMGAVRPGAGGRGGRCRGSGGDRGRSHLMVRGADDPGLRAMGSRARAVREQRDGEPDQQRDERDPTDDAKVERLARRLEPEAPLGRRVGIGAPAAPSRVARRAVPALGTEHRAEPVADHTQPIRLPARVIGEHRGAQPQRPERCVMPRPLGQARVVQEVIFRLIRSDIFRIPDPESQKLVIFSE